MNTKTTNIKTIKRSVRSVLFDLDGTLLDTAPDLIYALNQLRKEYGLDELPLETIRPLAGLGSKAMVVKAFGIDEKHNDFNYLREKFLVLYEQHIARSTRFFPHVESVLQHLDQNNMPWGIVTNKLSRHTMELLKALRFAERPHCVISGDSVTTCKPNPEPILHACQLLKQDPAHCIYVGDTLTDVHASKAAGTLSLVALYGYIQAGDDPYSWGADGYIHALPEIMDWIAKYP